MFSVCTYVIIFWGLRLFVRDWSTIRSVTVLCHNMVGEYLVGHESSSPQIKIFVRKSEARLTEKKKYRL